MEGKTEELQPRNVLDRLAATTVVSLFLMVFAQWMHADVRTWHYIAQVACFAAGALLLGVAGGCGVGVFTFRRGLDEEGQPR